jgi:hypothetical protein
MQLVSKFTNSANKIIAFSVISGAILLGVGIHHGEFHTNSTTTHCHADGVCHQH